MIDGEKLTVAVRTEFHKHTWDTFVDEPPSIARGGKGVVVPGCPKCRVRLNTVGQFVDHLTAAVLQAVSACP